MLDAGAFIALERRDRTVVALVMAKLDRIERAEKKATNVTNSTTKGAASEQIDQSPSSGKPS